MNALLLAAGKGERLRPLTNKIPKCLVQINGIPLLDIWILTLLNIGIDKILINTHYLSDKVHDHIVRSKYKNKIDIVYEEELLGTGGTIKKNIDFFGNNDGLIIHADNYCRADLKSFLHSHITRPYSCVMTMMTFKTDNPEQCGIIKINNNNIVEEYYEKIKNPPGNIANAAIFAISNDFSYIIKKFTSNNFDFCKDFIPTILGRVATHHIEDFHCDIGTINNLKIANNYAKNVTNDLNKKA